MRLYRLGDRGRPVRDIQDRLAALGHGFSPDAPGEFGTATRAAVVGFQRVRGLSRDGIVGPDTWRSLVESGYRPGDRLLYLRRPMMRGDDVGEVQRQLNALGFDAGKVDGIFGPDTQRALLDFQENRGMSSDGILGPETIRELEGIERATLKAGRAELRERQWLRGLPGSVVGAKIFLDPGCSDTEESSAAWQAASAAAEQLQDRGGVPLLSRSSDVHLPPRIRAQRANRKGADLVVSFARPSDGTEGVFYFASAHSSSEAGEVLARAIAGQLGVPTDGRARVMLKETRAPATIVCIKDLEQATGNHVAAGIAAFFSDNGR